MSAYLIAALGALVALVALGAVVVWRRAVRVRRVVRANQAAGRHRCREDMVRMQEQCGPRHAATPAGPGEPQRGDDR